MHLSDLTPSVISLEDEERFDQLSEVNSASLADLSVLPSVESAPELIQLLVAALHKEISEKVLKPCLMLWEFCHHLILKFKLCNIIPLCWLNSPNSVCLRLTSEMSECVKLNFKGPWGLAI
jgi:hypothetical protein